MSNRLYLDGIGDASGSDVTIGMYPSNIVWPTELMLKYKPTIDGSINIQRRINDDRGIEISFDSVKERELVMSGAVSASGSTSEFTTNFSGYLENDSFIGYYVKFTSGSNDGVEKKITDSTSGTPVLTTVAFDNVPAVADTFEIYRIPDWIDDILDARYVLTGYEFDLKMESGYSVSVLPSGISSQRVIIIDVKKDRVPTSNEQNVYNMSVLLRKKV